MTSRRSFWLSTLPVILAALLLVLALAGGSVWHNHTGTSAANCPTCHFSHQTATPQLAASGVSSPTLIGTTSVPADSIDVAGPSLPLSISRAPPTA